MKALVLASTLGLSLVAGSAMAATSMDSTAVFRTDAVKVETADKDVKKSNDWRRTEFNPVETAKKDAQTSKIWREIKF